ncbi:acyltransferase family protein [Marinovum algicola]|uniref:acyltransferase family protein n=1 Tax=Marinovum algicola TaxID=42444 RepID=UPI0024BB313E|nr:acyltransferase [Marinovum algicola]
MSRPPEIAAWTALRGLAALWVVLFHFWPQTAAPVPLLVARGYLAVDLFFCLSGAVMMLVYAPLIPGGDFGPGRFLWRRFARLYPVHLVTLGLAALILAFGPAFAPARPLSYDIGEMALLHLALLHAWGMTETGGLNYPSWSIAAEAFAYLLFPLLAAWMLRLPPGRALASSLAVAMIWITAIEAALPAPGLAFTRLENDFGGLRILPEFLVGMGLAYLFGGRRAPRLGRALCAAAVALQAAAIASQADALFLAGLPLLLAGLLLWRPGPPRALLYLGRISYCLYMVHALVQIPGFKLIEQFTESADRAAPGWALPLLLALSLCAADRLHRWVEAPARRLLLRGPAPAREDQGSAPNDSPPPAPAPP